MAIENKNAPGNIFGALFSKKDIRDYRLSQGTSKVAFPEEFQLSTVSVKQQGSVGACVAFSVSEVMEYFNKIQLGITKRVSPGFIYGNRRDTSYKKSGMYVRDALNVACKYGSCFMSDFSRVAEVPKAIELFEERYDELASAALGNRFSTYFRVYTKEDIKYALMTHGPVIFAINWYNDMSVDSEGILRTKYKGGLNGAHCMVIYGWDKNGWKIQNSWGILWGKAGRAILPYDIRLTEAWGITDTIVENFDIKKPKFAEWFAKIINFILNLFRKNKER